MSPGDARQTVEREAPPPPDGVGALRPPRPRSSRTRAATRPAPSRRAQDVASDLLQLVLTTPSVEAYLDELVVLAGGVNPVVAGCCVVLRPGPHPAITAHSNPLAGELDEVQVGLGQGPGLSALETAQAVVVDDLTTERRFGAYPARAREHGVLSSFSVPLTVGGAVVGVLTSYARDPHSFTRVVREGLTGFAAQAEVALALALRAASTIDVAQELQTALHVRSTTDRAVGILMARQECDAERAFAALRATARTSDRSIGEVASELVATTTTTGGRARAARPRA